MKYVFRKLIYLYIPLFLGIASLVFYCFGLMFVNTYNLKQEEHFNSFTPALPSKVLDIRGDLITEFSLDEKREIVAFENISKNLINALIAREDRSFFDHKGFNLKAIFRAVAGVLLHRSMGGGSTITQQIAGSLYCDRSEKSLKRKILELWYALQMERRFSKNEIMELYLNEVYFGCGTYGVGAASRFYFGHGADELNPAESALLVIQLSNPAAHNPFEHPDLAKEKQQYVLDGMIELKFTTEEEAVTSFNDYWDSFDYTRVSISAWSAREDRARWFSEYVRRELEEKMLGDADIYVDGYTVHTTCDLRHQEIAQAEINEYIDVANKRVEKSSSYRGNIPSTKYANLVSIIALVCNVEKLDMAERRVRSKAMTIYDSDVAPTVDILASLVGADPLKKLSKQQVTKRRATLSKSVVEGTMICLENETGYITSIIGGGKFHEGNQLIRATQAKLQVGSTFKPIIYSAALDARKITASTMLEDTPQVFTTTDGVQYIPNNFSGKFKGTVLVYEALPMSLNIPAISILDKVGFEPAIRRAAALVGIEDENEIEKTFERVYPLALGISSLSPLQLARAFAIFGNQGKIVEPFAIRRVESRNGNIALDVEKDIRVGIRLRGKDAQVISPQNAYIITDMLKRTLTIGTMGGSTKGGGKFVYKDEKTGKTFKMPVAGKTGTTQNFTDSWTAAYSPYYTTVAWFGFDRRGQSLGQQNTGAGLAAYPVANFMAEIHKGKPKKDFVRPETGLRYVKVCKISGDLPSPKCKDGTVDLWFLAGTEPKETCSLHESQERIEELGLDRLRKTGSGLFRRGILELDEGLSIDAGVFGEPELDFDEEDPNEYLLEKEDEDIEGNAESKENAIPVGTDRKDEEENDIENKDDGDSKDDDDDDDDGGGEVNPWL